METELKHLDLTDSQFISYHYVSIHASVPFGESNLGMSELLVLLILQEERLIAMRKLGLLLCFLYPSS